MKSKRSFSKFLLMFSFAIIFAVATAGQAGAQTETLFWEDFNGYSYTQDNAGIPKISEGADEVWYGGRFEQPQYGGGFNNDLAIQAYGGSTNPTPVGRFEDEAGLLFNISTLGYTDVDLSFDYRTFSAGTHDRLVAGYYVVGEEYDPTNNPGEFNAELNFGPCTGEGEAGCFRDFYNDDFGGVQNDAVNWWDDQWHEVERYVGNTFQSMTVSLPDEEASIWVAFWLDNGENDYGKIDNIHVQATVVPEPISSTLFLVGAATLGYRRFRKNS